MTKKFKITNGGLYLVNPGKTMNPELNAPHYCVVIKTHDKDLFIALPTTSKNKDDLYKHTIPEDNSKCLFKHMRVVSRSRILKPLLDLEGKEVIMSNQSMRDLLEDYQYFIKVMCDNAIISNKMYFESLEKV